MIVLIVEEGDGHDVERQLHARPNDEVVEANAFVAHSTMELRCHLADVVRRSAHVRDGKHEHELVKA